eukprot:SAG31_NODE_28694_length_406_cov_1.006515_1_plen_111_part_01
MRVLPDFAVTDWKARTVNSPTNCALHQLHVVRCQRACFVGEDLRHRIPHHTPHTTHHAHPVQQSVSAVVCHADDFPAGLILWTAAIATHIIDLAQLLMQNRLLRLRLHGVS